MCSYFISIIFTLISLVIIFITSFWNAASNRFKILCISIRGC